MMAEPQAKKVEKKDKPTVAEKSRRLGWRFGVGATIATAALVAAMAFQRCGGEPQVEGPVVDCPPAVTCPAAPAKGDNNCELEKGEHDMWSQNWDPESCGFCGDRAQQEWETPQTCPVDFACGDGEVQRRAKTYGAIVKTVEGENTTYHLGTVDISESCREGADNFCGADCPTATKRTGRTGPRRDRDRPEPVATTKRPPRAGGACDSSVTGGATSLYSRVIRQVTSSSGSIKGALNAGQAPVQVAVRVRISESGVPTVVGASATCGGSRCNGSANIVNLAGVNVGGISVSNGGPACTLTIPVTLR
jgi:hypothetical protein